MKKSDYLMGIGVIILAFLLVFPLTGNAFFEFTNDYALLGGFIKFALFATLGDLFSQRIRGKNYKVIGLLPKAFIWGFIGIVIVLIFGIFTEGVYYLQSVAILPFEGIAFFSALFISILMNVTFGPTMMLFHRLSDHFIEHKIVDKEHRFNDTLKAIDYHGFMSFVVFKTIPFFWIPAHTITFLLPDGYRVFFASLLGIMLGLILGFAKRKKGVN